MDFTEKKLVELLNVSQPALFKALKNTDFVLKEVQGSTKTVKHYKFDDLPQRYIDKYTTPISQDNYFKNLIP